MDDLSEETIVSDMDENKVGRDNMKNICGICMAHLSSRPTDNSDGTDDHSVNNIERVFRRLKRYTSTHYMRTPCQHEYHIGCLLSWMKVKMECPTCRGELPMIS